MIVDRHREVLERTPSVLNTLLRDLPEHWTQVTEGEDTWSPFDVVGHLVHGERHDWIPRVQRLIEFGERKTFDPFDRFAQFQESKGKTLNHLLDEFATARAESLRALDALQIDDTALSRTGRHPNFGVVQLGQLLATWVAHDLGHIGQVTRVMAKQYKKAVGPWSQFLRVVNS